MNLQQLRYLCAIVDHGLNVSAAADSLFTSQPGISKQIRQLEDELGVPIFIRQGKRLTTLTVGGEAIVASARRALQEIGNLRRIGAEFKSEDTGTLAIATTHLQARYVLPPVLKRFAERYPKVRVLLQQGDPVYVGRQTARGEADLGIATEALNELSELVTLPCYSWNRCVLVPKGHALSQVRPLTLEALAKYPIVTYHAAFTGRSKIDAAFDAKGLEPNIVLTALDSDVIKTYVEFGLGVGIVSLLAYDPARDTQFDKLDASHLFGPSTARLGLRRGVFLRGFVYDFITMFAPQFDRSAVEAALRGEAESYEL